MTDMLIRAAQRMRPWQIVAVSMLASVVLTECIVVIMAIFLNGAVTYDFLIIGAVCAIVVSFAITTIIVIALSRLRDSEARYDESEERYRQIFQQATDYIIMLEFSPDGPPLISDANELAFKKHGYTRDEMIGKPITFLEVEATSDDRMAEIMRLLMQNKEARFEAEHLRKDGGTFTVEVNAKLITIGGKPVVYTIERDITERKKLEEHKMELMKQTVDAMEEAQEANRLKSEFLANMSHEVNTPITSVLGYSRMANELDGELAATLAEVIKLIEQSDGAQTALLADIKSLVIAAQETARETATYDNIVLERGNALFNLLNDLMDLSLLDSGQMQMAEGTVSIYLLMTLMDKTHAEAAKAKGLSFLVNATDFRPTDVLFQGDRKKLEKVLNHLVENAIKYSDKGKIILNASREAEQLVFRVKDEGVGILSGDKEKIFESFRQLDGSSTRQRGGLGVGLALARKLVLAMGGDLRVQSEPGKGSEFIVTLPYRPQV